MWAETHGLGEGGSPTAYPGVCWGRRQEVSNRHARSPL